MVLLVDDDIGIRGLIKTVLSRDGIQIDVAVDGEEATRKLRQKDYRVVLLDLMMPKCNGLEVLRFIKHEMPAMMRRVIILTAVSDHALRDLKESDEVWALMRKPFDIRRLVAEVRACSGQV